MDINIKEYLTKLNATTYTDLSLENLTQLQNLHLQHIPFENLDVIRRIPIYLNLNTIYEKVVTRNRGGFCYELNGLFHTLLENLGYTAHLIAATVRKPTGDWAKANTHAALLVHLERPYLVDIGFGAATPRLPIPLDGTRLDDNVGAIYWTEKVEENLYDLKRKSDESERTLYRFRTNEVSLINFHEGCVYNQVSKDSIFTHQDIASIATPTGRYTLTENTLTKFDNGETETSTLNEKEKVVALEKLFNIQL